MVNVPDTNFFLQIDDDKNIMFLQGGIQAEYGTRVAGAGDIITGNIAKQLIQVFDKVKDDTIIMLMEVDNE